MSNLISAGEDGPPRLAGGRCRACGYVFFPLQRYGCERCGSHGDAIAPEALPAEGIVESAAMVHLHAAPERPVPFVVVSVRLDNGPAVRALIDGAHEPEPGTRVTGGFATGAGGNADKAFRFVATEGKVWARG